MSTSVTSKIPLYLTGACSELERIRVVVAELESAAELELTSRWGDAQERWTGAPGGLEPVDLVERLRRVFTLVRRAGIVWVLWPEATLSECVAGSLAYALAHRWHVGPRLHVVTSGPSVGGSALALSADFSAVNDAAALAHCIARARSGSVRSHRALRPRRIEVVEG